MKVALLKVCVIGVGKTGKKGETVELEDKAAKQLIASGAAAKTDSAEAKEAAKEAKEAAKQSAE